MGVRVVGTVADARAALDAEPFDHILLDLMLPDGSGTAVLQYVRSRGLPTRVVVCTAVGDDRWLDEVRALNPAAVLRKPLELDQLMAAVRNPPQ